MPHLLINVVVLSILFALSGFFSAAETALFSLSKIEKRRIEESHPHLGRWVIYHLNHPRQTLSTILIGNIMVQTLAAALTTLLCIDLWGSSFLGLAMTGYTLLFILFFEVIPKVMAVRQNEVTAILISWPLYILGVLLFPFRLLTRFVSDRVVSLFSSSVREHKEILSEDELKTLVKIGEEEGVLDGQERHMIHKLFELGERPVREIMTPRVDVSGLDVEDPPDEHERAVKKDHFTHFPVFRESLDHIIGVIETQEYMLQKGQKLEAVMKQPLYVPETKLIDELLEEFRRKNASFAVCVDEHGGTAGIVTLEDILEEIFGEFYDEYAVPDKLIRPYGYREFLVEARISLADFNEYFHTELESEEASTLGGYILEEMGEVPVSGKVLRTEEMEIRINRVVRQRILSVVVRLVA